jgi:hypothetical protein
LNPDDLTYCEDCRFPITLDHPGAVFLVFGTKYPPGTDIALHDEDCRLAWFKEHPPTVWVKDHEVIDNP